MQERDDDISTASQISTADLEDVYRQLKELRILRDDDANSDFCSTTSSSDNEDDVTSSTTAVEGPPLLPPPMTTTTSATTSLAEPVVKVVEPPSFYQLLELNKGPVDSTVRMARVPSQYQLDTLTEVYLFDVPQLSGIRRVDARTGAVGVDSVETAMETSVPMPIDTLFPSGNHYGLTTVEPFLVRSEYVSELLV